MSYFSHEKEKYTNKKKSETLIRILYLADKCS